MHQPRRHRTSGRGIKNRQQALIVFLHRSRIIANRAGKVQRFKRGAAHAAKPGENSVKNSGAIGQRIELVITQLLKRTRLQTSIGPFRQSGLRGFVVAKIEQTAFQGFLKANRRR